MSRHIHFFLTLATTIAGVTAVRVQSAHCQATPGEEPLTYTKMVRKVCGMKWLKGSEEYIWDHMQEDCWAMRVYNWDRKMRSVLYQNEVDGRCALVFSGYNGAIIGYIKAALDLSTPMTTWKVCGNEMFAPYVKVLRMQTQLANWSKIANFLGGNDTTCKGELLVLGESAGSAAAEVLAACANSGNIGEIQDKELPPFQVDALYTFGSPATAMKPIANPLHPKGCFRGKRVLSSQDQVAFHMPIKGLKHSMTDAIEIFQRADGPTFKVTPCLSNVSSPASNDHTRPGPPLDTALKWTMPQGDPIMHEPGTYLSALTFFQLSGFGRLEGLDLVVPDSDIFVNAERIRNKDMAN